jgi:hypothetical protein
MRGLFTGGPEGDLSWRVPRLGVYRVGSIPMLELFLTVLYNSHSIPAKENSA